MRHIVGIIRTTTHVHQKAPDSTSGNESSTIKTWVWGPDDRRHLVPYVTANSVRGLLRRHAADIALDAMNAKVSRQLYHNLTRGSQDRAGIGAQAPTTALVEGGKNIFAGLFGGGPYMLHSRYSMGPLYPTIAWCRRFLHHSIADRAIPVERLQYKIRDGDGAEESRDAPLTDRIILAPRDGLLEGKGERHIENYRASLDKWLAEVIAGRGAKAEDKAAKAAARERGEKPTPAGKEGAKSVDLTNFTLTEAILPGTPLQFWMRFRPGATDGQIGLALMAVRDWANANVLGGSSSRGFGRFEAELSLWNGDSREADNIFAINDHVTSYTLSQSVARYVDTAEKELKSLTVEKLETYYPTVTKVAKDSANE